MSYRLNDRCYSDYIGKFYVALSLSLSPSPIPFPISSPSASVNGRSDWAWVLCVWSPPRGLCKTLQFDLPWLMTSTRRGWWLPSPSLLLTLYLVVGLLWASVRGARQSRSFIIDADWAHFYGLGKYWQSLERKLFAAKELIAKKPCLSASSFAVLCTTWPILPFTGKSLSFAYQALVAHFLRVTLSPCWPNFSVFGRIDHLNQFKWASRYHFLVTIWSVPILLAIRKLSTRTLNIECVVCPPHWNAMKLYLYL